MALLSRPHFKLNFRGGLSEWNYPPNLSPAGGHQRAAQFVVQTNSWSLSSASSMRILRTQLLLLSLVRSKSTCLPQLHIYSLPLPLPLLLLLLTLNSTNTQVLSAANTIWLKTTPNKLKVSKLPTG